MPGHKGKTLLAKVECGRQQPHAECLSSPGSPGFFILSLMEPLHQAEFIIPQIIMSLGAVSIATCNKLSEIMTPFHGDKKQPRINVTTGNMTFYWHFDMGTSITCMSTNSFRQAFEDTKPRLIQKGNRCVATNRLRMNFLGSLRYL